MACLSLLQLLSELAVDVLHHQPVPAALLLQLHWQPAHMHCVNDGC